MIYKNDLRIKKIETVIEQNPDKIIVHLHLSDGEVFTFQPKDNVDPSLFNNKAKLLAACIMLQSKAVLKFEEVLNDKT